MTVVTDPALLLLERQRAVSVARESQHDELEWLGGRGTDFRDQLAVVHRGLRVVRVVACHEERLRLSRAAKSAQAKELSQITLEREAHFEAERGVVRLKYHPLHLLFERAFDHREQTAHAQLTQGRNAAQ